MVSLLTINFTLVTPLRKRTAEETIMTPFKSLFAITFLTWSLQAAGQESISIPVSTPVELGGHQMRLLVQLRPGDITCVEAHQGHFGQHIPGVISLEPMKGDTGWWWNKITDYDQRVTRIKRFSKILPQNENCADYAGELPQSNLYVEFKRVVTGQPVIVLNHKRAGTITETVEMIFSPRLTLVGSNTWTDWVVPEGVFDPKRPFDNSLLNEFQNFEQKDLRLTTDAQNGLECRRIENRVNLVFKARESDLNNEIQLRRVFADEEACTDALTALSQSLEARGRTWLTVDLTGNRRLWTTSRGDQQDCDTVRVERIETEIEGIKFVGTNFIQTSRGGICRN